MLGCEIEVDASSPEAVRKPVAMFRGNHDDGNIAGDERCSN